MPGYSPRCPNCFRCPRCRGEGTIQEAEAGKKSDGSGCGHFYRRVTCPRCNGRGGSPGAGPHDHN